MNLLILQPGERLLVPDDPRTRHIRRVLRLGPGDRLRAGELGGAIGVACVVSDTALGITLEFEPLAAAAPAAPVELLLGHPRPIVLRRMLRDLAAIGPQRIIVTHTDLGERSYQDANLWDDTRTPMIEGASQGGTTLLPELIRESALETALGRLFSSPGGRLVLHDTGEHATPLFEALAVLSGGQAPVALAVGSERGWTERELGVLGQAGFRPCSLGSRTLRTETAAAIAVWAAVWGVGLPS